jgi:hypothetical protein
MRRICKVACLLLTLIVTLSAGSLIKPTSAQDIPKPAVPEFTIRYVEHPFDVPPTYQIDQYSGENVTIQEGYHIQNRSIELLIKNQPYTPYEDSSGNLIALFYNVSSKGNNGSQWYYYPTWMRTLPVNALNNEYTILSFGLDVNYEEDNEYGFWYGDLSTGDKVDFRIQALIGYYSYPLYNVALEYNTFIGKVSGWSNTQTISIPNGEVSTSSPSPSPSVPEFPTLIVILLAIIPISYILIIRKSKKRYYALNS